MTTLTETKTPVKFALGKILATPTVIDLIPPHERRALYARHARNDWGDMCDDDKAANDQALINGSRIFSGYETSEGKVWIITEADRSATTMLFPSEY